MACWWIWVSPVPNWMIVIGASESTRTSTFHAQIGTKHIKQPPSRRSFIHLASQILPHILPSVFGPSIGWYHFFTFFLICVHLRHCLTGGRAGPSDESAGGHPGLAVAAAVQHRRVGLGHPRVRRGRGPPDGGPHRGDGHDLRGKEVPGSVSTKWLGEAKWILSQVTGIQTRNFGEVWEDECGMLLRVAILFKKPTYHWISAIKRGFYGDSLCWTVAFQEADEAAAASKFPGAGRRREGGVEPIDGGLTQHFWFLSVCKKAPSSWPTVCRRPCGFIHVYINFGFWGGFGWVLGWVGGIITNVSLSPLHNLHVQLDATLLDLHLQLDATLLNFHLQLDATLLNFHLQCNLMVHCRDSDHWP